MPCPRRHICFTPESGHCDHDMECRLRARRRLRGKRKRKGLYRTWDIGSLACFIAWRLPRILPWVPPDPRVPAARKDLLGLLALAAQEVRSFV